jgi:hypothetical protein
VPSADVVTVSANGETSARRRFLASAVGVYIASLLPRWPLAQPVADPNQVSFTALSAVLVGRASLDPNQGNLLYRALVSDDPGFPAAASALLSVIESRKVDPLRLQATLDADKSPLAPLPRKIATAWYMGVVGEGDRARCIAFETALNAVVVADVLKPPTYCYGPYGSWARKPT